jgi:dihydrodipicolinate synthase/N-acetylneuraminate lyase
MTSLPKGIVSVLQTPFDENNKVDFKSLELLIEEAINGGVSGFLVPVVASEVACLEKNEREAIVEFVKNKVSGRVCIIVGASSDNPTDCLAYAQAAEKMKTDGYLVAVPQSYYQQNSQVIPFFKQISKGIKLPLIIQDLQFNGPGLPLSIIKKLKSELPTLSGLKIETLPSGPKYTAIKNDCGPDLWIAGGWAITQMIEALDRGVDAMVPESSMVKVYTKIYQLYSNGDRKSALELFRKLQPVLCYSNQDLGTSIAFFKRLLVQKGIFNIAHIRLPGFEWDEYNSRIADELIDLYLDLELDCSH